MTYEERRAYIWNELLKAGYREIETAGIMGNLYEESGLRPDNLQNIYEKILGMTDKQYTDAINSGTYSYKQFYNDHAGYGLAQWTYYSRKQRLYQYCYPNIGSLELQTAFLISELKLYPHVIAMLHKCNTIRECSDVILHYYEQPGDQSVKVEIRRAGYGEEIYNAMHNPEPTPVPVNGWYVCQCAAYKTEKGALTAAEKLKDAHVYRSHTEGYYAVGLGQYDSEAQAKKNLAEAQKQRKDAFVTFYEKERLIK